MFSTNELELLAVVWAIENFRNYVWGTEFEAVSDHKALMTISKDNRANKTFSSRLTRWVDCLLLFQFKVVHAPGRTLGIVDYLSRQPWESNSKENKIKAEELWHNWFTVTKTTQTKFVSATRQPQKIAKQPIREQVKGARDLAKASDAASATEQRESANESNSLDQRKTNTDNQANSIDK